MGDQLKRELYLEFTPFGAEDEQDKLDYKMAQEVPQEAFLPLSTPRPQGNARFYVLYADGHRNYMWGERKLPPGSWDDSGEIVGWHPLIKRYAH